MKLILSKSILVISIIYFSAIDSEGQKKAEVLIPKFNDQYTSYVKKLEGGEFNINFKEFRESFIKSEQFRIASKKNSEFEKLKKDMYEHIAKSDYHKIVKITKAMLSIDYTSMLAHKVLRQTYSFLGDSVNTIKYRTIQLGLLNSIIKKGDGKTHATAWHVVQMEEENFILHLLGAKITKQSVENAHGIFDKMEVNIKGEKQVYYFEISKIFEGYKYLEKK